MKTLQSSRQQELLPESSYPNKQIDTPVTSSSTAGGVVTAMANRFETLLTYLGRQRSGSFPRQMHDSTSSVRDRKRLTPKPVAKLPMVASTHRKSPPIDKRVDKRGDQQVDMEINKQHWRTWEHSLRNPESTSEQREGAVNALSEIASSDPGDAELVLSDMNLHELPPRLPESVQKLILRDNRLGQLARPQIPDSLRFLNFSGNDAADLPTLPPSLEMLDASRNRLGVLPALPATLKALIIDDNLLPILPALPEGLVTLKADPHTLRQTLEHWHKELREAGRLTRDYPNQTTLSAESFLELGDEPALAGWEIISPSELGGAKLPNASQPPSGVELVQQAINRKLASRRLQLARREEQERHVLDDRITLAMDQICILERFGIY